MKKILCLLSFLCVSISLFSQAQITTKKEKLSDFRTKITKIVLPGDPFLDPAVKEAAKNTWTISPFEICSRGEFEELCFSSDYYFLMLAESLHKEESLGVEVFQLIKGGTGDSLDNSLHVISFPFRAAGGADGREITFLPAIFSIIQDGAKQTIDSGMKPSGSQKLRKGGSSPVYIASDDLTESGKEAAAKAGGINVISSEEAEDIFDSGADALVGYVVAPSEASPGKSCHVMLIDARTHKLCYLRRHKISENKGSGFTGSDIKSISASTK